MANSKLKNHEMVKLIIEFLNENSRTNRKVDDKLIEEVVQDLIKNKRIQDELDIQTLRHALMLQHNAMLIINNMIRNKTFGTKSDFTFSKLFDSAASESNYKSEKDGLGKLLGIIATILLGGAIITPFAAAYGMGVDLYEISKELFYSQRVAANVATLSLTSAYIIGATIAAVAIFSSNPVLWGVLAVIGFVVGVALLVKGTRALINVIDDALDEQSAITSDSRFKLTPKEETALLDAGFSAQDVEKVKDAIKGLSISASYRVQMGFFGSDNDYLAIIDILTAVKKGDIPQEIRDAYGIKSVKIDPSEPIPLPGT